MRKHSLKLLFLIVCSLLWTKLVYPQVCDTASSIVVSSHSIPADGISICTVTVFVKSDTGGPVSGKWVTISTSRGPSYDTLTQPATPTDTNGQCTGILYSSYAGEDTITAISDGTTISYMLFDDFSFYNTGTNGSPVWTTVSGTWTVEDTDGNKVYTQTDTTGDRISTAGSFQWRDYTFEVSAKVITGGSTLAIPCFRYQASNNYYYAILYTSGNLQLKYYGAGNPTLNSVTGCGSPLSWRNFKIEVSGSNPVKVKIWLDGVLKIDHSEYTYIATGGKIALRTLAWASFDNVKVYPCKINFTATKLKITSSPFTITMGNPSSAITVEAQDVTGTKDAAFNETISLFSGSPTGKFSLSNTTWVDTSSISLVSGQRAFYYKDSQTGNPVITVYRLGLQSDTQTETILEPSVNETYSTINLTPITVIANGLNSSTVIVTIGDTYGYPVSNKSVTLFTVRGVDSTTISANPQTTDSNGQCTFTISSTYIGKDTVTANCDGNTIGNIFSDDFSAYTEGSAGSPVWTTLAGTWTVESAEYSHSNTSTIDARTWKGTQSWTNYTYEAKVKIFGGNSATGITFRMPSSNNGYVFWISAAQTVIQKMVSGSRSDIATRLTEAHSLGTWYSLKVVVDGSSIKTYVDNALKYDTAVDMTFSSGSIGLWTYQTHSHFDDIKVYPPVVNFTASKLRVASDSFTIKALQISPQIKVVAQDNYSNTDTTFNNTVALATSSSFGQFSISNTTWTNTTIITFSNGTGYFYYRDEQTGSPMITVLRDGLVSDTQIETITSGAIKPGIATPPRTSVAGNASESIAVQALTNTNSIDSSYNGVCTFSSSSFTGKFCATQTGETWTSTVTLNIVNGETIVYYKDTKAGSPAITVSSSDLGNTSQIQSIVAGSINETSSYIVSALSRVPADGSSTCTVVVTINDAYHNPLYGKSVTLSAVRGNSDTIIVLPPENGITNPSGQCTFTISSVYAGYDTLTTICEGNTIARPMNKYGAVGIWCFDSDTLDHSGYGNNGVTGGNTSPVWVSGKYGSALQFDGIDDYVDCLNTSSLQITGDLTLEAWINPSVLDAVFQFFISKSHLGEYEIGRNSTAVVYRHGNGVTYAPLQWSNFFSEGTNQWYHVVLTRTSSDSSIRLYKNGEQFSSSNSYTLAPVASSYALQMGRRSSSTLYFYGIIDEVKIYARALSAEEIRSAYKSRVNVYFTATGFTFTSLPFTINQNSPSPAITVEARGNSGDKDASFNETVTLSSSSGGGKFSLNQTSWSTTLATTFNSGSLTFYYKDSSSGTPTLTVSRAGLASGVQSETILAVVTIPNRFTSSLYYTPLSVKANGIDTLSVVVTINDTSWTSLAGKSVTLSSVRGTTNISANTQTTDANGQCTFTIYSGYAGADTMVANCEGETFTHTFYDDFSIYTIGSNGSPAWTIVSGNWKVEDTETNKVYTQSDTSGDKISTAGSLDWSDYVFEVRAKALTGGARQLAMPCFRYQTSNNYYYLILEGGTLQLKHLPSGVILSSVSGVGSSNSWRNFKIEVSGSGPVKIKVWVDDALKIDRTENTNIIAKGKIAFRTVDSPASFDNIKVYSQLYFTAAKLGFGTNAFKVKAGGASAQVTVSAQGINGGTDVNYNNTTVLLATSSNSGSFSNSSTIWASINELTLANGTANFYYMDYRCGNPVITVYRAYGDLDTGTQMETVTAAFIKITSTPFTVSISETSPGATLSAQDYAGETDTNFSETAVLISSSSRGKFSISNTTWNDTTIVKFSAGYAEFYYKDKRGGKPTITVSISALALSDNQTETIVMPIITTSKQMRNERTNASDTLVTITSGDTVEYTLTITNNGFEIARNVIVTDTPAFDTGVYTNLAFVSMDTAPQSDSWTYTSDGTNWLGWNSYPPGENVKGLRWHLNSIGIGENKAIRFRVRIK